ncbi:TPR end-of-group domain-containing protein [Leptospira mayottensis]|uniref:TPR end-of-group domain-containing protein n=1 Tax=Leptospira mayottensis TaxID=1137606 RepID=UPI0002BE607C|nr:hypothetical protein [Leptospira mayottensis]AXR61943.1 hypothetical protein DQM68_15945 [Leptospira mayottensis]AZQ01605.1 hypothetical protein LEP1GSC190_05780 [Leptospira mayottensis 200901116]TGM95300.1 hypothetical protein EHR03_16635 [Leptospira mayottensis]
MKRPIIVSFDSFRYHLLEENFPFFRRSFILRWLGLFSILLLVFNLSILAEENDNFESENNSLENNQEISHEDLLSDWWLKSDRTWKAWIENENTAEEGEAKEEFNTAYSMSLDFYRNGSDRSKSEWRDEVLDWTVNHFNQSLGTRKMGHAAYILKLFYDVSRVIGIGNGTIKGIDSQNEYDIREYFAGDLIVYMQKANDFQYETFMKTLIPSKITDSRLVFNLACLNSNRGKKKEMLKYMKIALALGKPKSHFKGDPDFKKFWNDPDFLKLVKE